MPTLCSYAMPRFRTHLRAIPPYQSARDEYKGSAQVFLDANENPFACEWGGGQNRYPDPHHWALREALSQHLGVPPTHILCGNGSDEIIDWLIRATCEPHTDALLTLTPSYGVYVTYARLHGAEVKEVPLEPDFSLPVERLLAAASPSTPLAILCRPNNPTGTLWPAADVQAFIERFSGWVVLDEAYIEFSAEPQGWLARRQPNTILLRTFSKAWGMAGWRIGYAIADPEVVSLFYRTKLPYNLSAPAQEAALQALNRWPTVAGYIEALRAERQRLAQALQALPFIQEVFPSEANFLLVRLPQARSVYEKLLAQGIVTRYRGNLPLCEETLRISVGTPAENQQLIEALCAIFS